jgi:hypothetical protein
MGLFARKNAFLEMRCVIKNWWLTEGQLYNMLQLLSLFSGWITVDLHTFGVLLTFGGTGFTSTWFYMVFPDNRLYISQVGSVFFAMKIPPSLEIVGYGDDFRSFPSRRNGLADGLMRRRKVWSDSQQLTFWCGNPLATIDSSLALTKKQVTLSSTIRY